MLWRLSLGTYVIVLAALVWLLLRVLTKLKNSKREFFVVFLFCVVIYGLGVLFQIMATSIDGAILSLRLMALGGMLMSPVLLIYLQKYCEDRLPKWINFTVFISAFLLILLIWTPEQHNLIYASIYLHCEAGFQYVTSWDVYHGVLYPLLMVHPAVCTALSVMILSRKFRESDAIHKKRLAVLMFCTPLPTIIQMANILQFGNFFINYITIIALLGCAFIAHLRAFKYYLLESEEAGLSQNVLRGMISSISHDIKTPLTVLSVHIEKLLEASPDDSEYARDIRVAYNRNLDLQHLIENLIEITRIDAGAKVFKKPKWVPLDAVLADIQKKYGDYLESSDLFLDVIGHGKDDLIYIERAMVWSVFDNVIYNAVKNTAAGGITITAECTGDIATITVTDTGSGIAAEHLAHIFDRFYRVRTNRGRHGGDHGGDHGGIGLFIVKSVMEALGGQVRMESELGVGTSVILTFLRSRK